MWPTVILYVIHSVKLLSVIPSHYFADNNTVIVTVLATSAILSQYCQYMWVVSFIAKCHWMHWIMLESSAVYSNGRNDLATIF